jgi:hypothetical protein
MSSGTPMGPGFFIFFHVDEGRKRKIPLYKAKEEDIEEIDLIKILFSFLQNGDIK